MLSAGLLRRQLLQLLQERVIPVIPNLTGEHLMAALLPLAGTGHIGVRPWDIVCLDEAPVRDEYPWGPNWDAFGVHAIDYPALCCVVQGEIDLRLGITRAMRQGVGKDIHSANGFIVALPEPACLLIPAGVPYSTGVTFPWERPEPEKASAHVLWVRVLPSGALCHTMTVSGGTQEPQYSLLLDDALLAPMIQVMLASLQPSNREVDLARAQLHAFWLRIRQDLQQATPVAIDGLHSRFPAGGLGLDNAPPRIETKDGPVLERACEYIQLHLHEPLCPECISRHVRLQPGQLNRIFRRHFKTSVMRYVTIRRLEAAKLLLQTSELSVQEISRLVGYKYVSHFSKRFEEYEGRSPLRYRQSADDLRRV